MPKSYMHVGFHTGGFNSAYTSFEAVVAWASEHGIRNIECGFLDGVSWNHGLGYFPHIASWQDPLKIRDLLAEKSVSLSQIDAAFPVSGRLGPAIAVPYIERTIRWASLAGCNMVDTTDGLYMPEGMTESEAMNMMKICYQMIMETAERYGMIINIETHGYFTGKPHFLEEMLSFTDSSLLRLNFDTGNVFISGEDPAAFLSRFIDKTSHVHLKDVAPQRAESSRGKEFGIGMSHCSVGEGVLADQISACLKLLGGHGFNGDVSIECEAAGGIFVEQSIAWLKEKLDSLGIGHDIAAAAGLQETGRT